MTSLPLWGETITNRLQYNAAYDFLNAALEGLESYVFTHISII